jgi:hypothetical protein
MLGDCVDALDLIGQLLDRMIIGKRSQNTEANARIEAIATWTPMPHAESGSLRVNGLRRMAPTGATYRIPRHQFDRDRNSAE